MCKRTCEVCATGQWSAWGAWGVCTKSCGPGKMVRTRKCLGGKQCPPGYSRVVKYCNIQPCSTRSGEVEEVERPSTSTCGKRLGTNPKEGKQPWKVGIFTAGSFAIHPFCMGTLIDNRIVLTAASCFPDPPTKVIVKTGDRDPNGNMVYEREVSVSEIVKHPSFSPSDKQNDIALLILSDSIEFGPGVNAACLPQQSDVFSKCSITSWEVCMDLLLIS